MFRTGFLVFLWLSTVVAVAQVTAIKAGRIIHPATGEVLEGHTILVDGKRIRSIVPSDSLPSGAEVIDLSDMTVMPGLFDCHTHVCLGVLKGQSDYFAGSIAYSDAYRALQAVRNCREFLEAGFTTIRDVGNAGRWVDTEVRKAVERGFFPGPTIVTAGRIIAPFGGQFHLQPDRPKLAQPEYIFADTRDEMLKAVRENIHFGSQVIKIVMDDQPYIYTAEDVAFMVEEAGKAGLKVIAHCATEQGAKNAVEGGVASVEHGFVMSDETLRLAKSQGTMVCGTELTRRVWEEYGVPDTVGESLTTMFVTRLRRSYELGVKNAYGSDLIYWIPEMTRGEWALTITESFVEAGVPPLEILRAMTTHAAELLGMSSSRGALRPGMFADIIAMPDDPLSDIAALKGVSFVMKEGVVVKG